MEKILYIKGSPKETKDSYTLRLAEAFMLNYKKNNPDAEIIELDLYKEDLKHLDLEVMGALFSEEENKHNKHVNNFIKFDKYIIASPMWNFSIPSIVKTYIDHIAVVNKTFKYTENGPVGLLTGKKAIHICARGGNYSSDERQHLEMGDKYLRLMFNFMGISSFNTLSFENTAVYEKAKVEEHFSKLIENLDSYIKDFK